jgi:hypothetical protein
VVVCEVTLCVDDVFDEVELDDVVFDVVAVADDVSSDAPSPDDEVFDAVDFVVVRAAFCAVALVRPSCHASTPPSDSIEATLSAAAALRARAAFGLRRRRAAPARVAAERVVVWSCSFMSTTVRIGGERTSRGE